jgi:hypothetical protein
MILRSDGYSAFGSLHPGDVYLAHRHHRLNARPAAALSGLLLACMGPPRPLSEFAYRESDDQHRFGTPARTKPFR